MLSVGFQDESSSSSTSATIAYESSISTTFRDLKRTSDFLSPEIDVEQSRTQKRQFTRTIAEISSLSSHDRSSKLQPPLIERLAMRMQVKTSRLTAESPTESGTKSAQLKPTRYALSHIEPTELVYPKSLYQNHLPPLPVSTEHDAITTLLEKWSNSAETCDSETYVSFELENFSIYRDITGGKNGDAWESILTDHEFVPLHFLKAKHGINYAFFDGVLKLGTTRFYVEKVRFETVTVEGYGDDRVDSVASKICIQSCVGRRRNVWYAIGKPTHEYSRYHNGYLWVADFAKHVVDFLIEKDAVRIADFKSNFYFWISQRYNKSIVFAKWLAQYGKEDFRTAVHAYVSYLWKESVDVAPETRNHPLWREIDPASLNAVKEHRTAFPDRTIVTPFVYECFKDLYFGELLEARGPRDAHVHAAHLKKRRTLGFKDDLWAFESSNNPSSSNIPVSVNQNLPDVQEGDVIGIMRDHISAWKDKEQIWFGYVQALEKNRKGQDVLRLIWLYRPSDTTLSNMYYPLKRELFFSDHCNCGDEHVLLSDIVCKIRPEFFAHRLNPGYDCFIRQKYCADEQEFVTLRESDFLCPCRKPKGIGCEYQTGDSVLIDTVRKKGDNEILLEPAVVVNRETDGRINVRTLPRRSRYHALLASTAHEHCQGPSQDVIVSDDTCSIKGAQVRPNELLWSHNIISIPASRVVRRCHIRFYTEQVAQKRLPTPFDRDGAVDCFFISSILETIDGRTIVKPLEETTFSTLPLKQGFDPLAKPDRPQLRGLDLFCGGGNFGRGIGEGGAVVQKYAVDYWTHAIHTYRANLPDPENTSLYYGSVDDFFVQLLDSADVLEKDEINTILAGSPCQGMSNMQQDKLSQKSRLNTSKVASVAAYVDLLRPKYAIFENVIPLTAAAGPKRDQNVFSQLLCALVGLGYQVTQFILDAWSFGSSQSRSRVFISIAAPGLTPIPHPALTHSHPKDVKLRALGKAINGQPFGERRFDVPVFRSLTAADAVDDLPNIGDAHAETCIQSPDHRLTRRLRPLLRSLVTNMLPILPRETGIYGAAQANLVAEPQLNNWRQHSKMRTGPLSRSWMRVHPDKLLPIITTVNQPGDGLMGKSVHWSQDRLLTVMEARRAQGFPDDEVIVGLPRTQWQVIGNSVDRKVALALGMALRQAWLANASEQTQGQAESGPIAPSTLNLHASETLPPAQGLSLSVTKEPTHDEAKASDREPDLSESQVNTGNHNAFSNGPIL